MRNKLKRLIAVKPHQKFIKSKQQQQPERLQPALQICRRNCNLSANSQWRHHQLNNIVSALKVLVVYCRGVRVLNNAANVLLKASFSFFLLSFISHVVLSFLAVISSHLSHRQSPPLLLFANNKQFSRVVFKNYNFLG